MADSEDCREIQSRNLKKLRKIRGLSQEKLAEDAGISVYMVREIENCRCWVSDKTLMKLAKAFNIEIYRLFLSKPEQDDEFFLCLTSDYVNILKKFMDDIDKGYKQALKSLEDEK